jgi:hypothetical protein
LAEFHNSRFLGHARAERQERPADVIAPKLLARGRHGRVLTVIGDTEWAGRDFETAAQALGATIMRLRRNED